mgnify:CR=1 FL=1
MSKAITKYLDKYAEQEALELNVPKQSFSQSIVIPAFDETTDFVENLRIAEHSSVLGIVVVNRPDNASLDATKNSFALLSNLNKMKLPNLLIIDRVEKPLEAKKGVGLARKIGTDVALKLIQLEKIHSPWIRQTDADASIEKNYSLGKIVHFKGIKKGIENTNYLLKTKNKKFILTLFEKRVQKKDLPFFMNLMDKLNKYKINCPKPQKNKRGSFLIKIKNKTASIVSFVEGKDKLNLKSQDCYEIGKNIAKFHKASKKIKLFRKNSMSLKEWSRLINKIGNKSNKISPTLKNLMKNSFLEIKKKWPKNLPFGIIHGDLFIDNIFFKKKKFSGFIDFFFACNDFLIYEIAIAINALCFDNKSRKFIFNKNKSRNLIKGYSKVRTLSNIEKKSLNILCRGAALRYLLSRTYDYFNTPKSAIIKIKDPREYIQKLKIHNKLGNFKNYYN